MQISGGGELQQRYLTIQVDPTTAPDIYLLIGQSNMTGSSTHGAIMSQAGEPDAPDPRIQQLNVTSNERRVFSSQNAFSNAAINVGSPAIVTAQDPLHEELRNNQELKSGDQIGLALSFAKAALADTDSTILLVPAAWGGSGFCGNKNLSNSWNSRASSDPALGGTGLYHRAITRTDIALKQSSGILRGILWHQGETDATKADCAEPYATNLQQLVAALRQNISLDARGSTARGADSDIPFIAGTLSVGADKRGDYSIIPAPRQLVDNTHRSIADLVGHAGYSNNDDLVPPAYPCGDTSCIHFGATAYREMGQRYYQSLKRVIDQ